MSDEINLISEIREAERKAEEISPMRRLKVKQPLKSIREEYRQKTLIAKKDFSAARTGIIERTEKRCGKLKSSKCQKRMNGDCPH
jgi:hypothetical protein